MNTMAVVSCCNSSFERWVWMMHPVDGTAPVKTFPRIEAGDDPVLLTTGNNNILGDDQCWAPWTVSEEKRANGDDEMTAMYPAFIDCCLYGRSRATLCWGQGFESWYDVCCGPMLNYAEAAKHNQLGNGRGSSGRVVYMDLGAHDGAVGVGESGPAVDLPALYSVLTPEKVSCFLVEAIPKLYQKLEKRFGDHCTVIGRPAWIKDGVKMRFALGSELIGSSLYTEGHYTKNTTQIEVEAFDVAKLVRERFSPLDYNILRMDIEGAEYEVLRHLIMSGVACYFTEIEIEFHSLYSNQTVKYWPLDTTLVWFLESCGVRVSTRNYYYTDNNIRHEVTKVTQGMQCRHCEAMYDRIAPAPGYTYHYTQT